MRPTATRGVLVDGPLVERVEDGELGGVADLGGERLERLAGAPDEDARWRPRGRTSGRRRRRCCRRRRR